MLIRILACACHAQVGVRPVRYPLINDFHVGTSLIQNYLIGPLINVLAPAHLEDTMIQLLEPVQHVIESVRPELLVYLLDVLHVIRQREEDNCT